MLKWKEKKRIVLGQQVSYKIVTKFPLWPVLYQEINESDFLLTEIIARVILILATVTRALTALQKRQSSKIRQAIIPHLNQIWHVSVIASACAIARYLFIYLPLTELKVYNKNHLHSISYTSQW